MSKPTKKGRGYTAHYTSPVRLNHIDTGAKNGDGKGREIPILDLPPDSASPAMPRGSK